MALYAGHLKTTISWQQFSLLKDPRIDPSVKKNYAIKYASKTGYKEVVEMLLKDNRVDPAANDNYALRGNRERQPERIQGNCRDTSQG
jgi:hypothetical protein